MNPARICAARPLPAAVSAAVRLHAVVAQAQPDAPADAAALVHGELSLRQAAHAGKAACAVVDAGDIGA